MCRQSNGCKRSFEKQNHASNLELKRYRYLLFYGYWKVNRCLYSIKLRTIICQCKTVYTYSKNHTKVLKMPQIIEVTLYNSTLSVKYVLENEAIEYLRENGNVFEQGNGL